MKNTVNLKILAEFLVRAKKETYAGNGSEVEPERPGFKELEYKEGIWTYRDSYTGYSCAPGQEVVRINGQDVPIWTMAYSGGMEPIHLGDWRITKDTFSFLKDMLSRVDISAPYRGPVGKTSGEDGWSYTNRVVGNIIRFNGREEIRKDSELIFSQEYIGGLVIPKNGLNVLD